METTAVSNLDDFQALDPFFRIIEEGVAGLVDGDDFVVGVLRAVSPHGFSERRCYLTKT